MSADLRRATAAGLEHLRSAINDVELTSSGSQYALWSVGVYGFVFWLPTIVKAGSGQGIGSTGALSAIPHAAATVAMIAVSWFSDRTGRQRVLVWPPLLLGAAAFGASYLAGPATSPCRSSC